MTASVDTEYSGQRPGRAVLTQKKSRPFVVPLLFLGFIVPIYFDFLGLNISGYRIVLIVFFIPAMIKWIDGSDRIHTVDILMVCFAVWRALSILINHGAARWEFAGITLIETMAPYFIARWMIRDAHAFKVFVTWLLIVIGMMLPFSIHQFLTDKSVLLDFFANFGKAYETLHYEPRLGYYRAQGSMPHPILFGVFCSAAFSLVWYTLGKKPGLFRKFPRASIVGTAVFTSLSSGAFLSVFIQLMAMAWKTIFSGVQKKWNLLMYSFFALYLFLEIAANRSPAQLFAAHLTLNKASAWYRIHIFNYAVDDVTRNPFFGIGLKEWTRPSWLLASVDNFWLLVALRGGLPSLVLLLAVIILLFYNIGRPQLTGRLADYRLGYLFAVAGICIAAISVHLWDATFCFLMFLLGAGVWLIDAKDESVQPPADTGPAPRRKIRYTRFE